MIKWDWLERTELWQLIWTRITTTMTRLRLMKGYQRLKHKLRCQHQCCFRESKFNQQINLNSSLIIEDSVAGWWNVEGRRRWKLLSTEVMTMMIYMRQTMFTLHLCNGYWYPHPCNKFWSFCCCITAWEANRAGDTEWDWSCHFMSWDFVGF